MKKILAIDDSELNLRLLLEIAKIHYPNFQFLQATMGQEGIEIARKENPELILLDILMPGLNGYEVCKILKNDKLTSHIPIVMISALGQDSVERIKGLKAGADAFISKPFNQNELRAQIDVAIRIKRVEDLLRERNESLELYIKDQTDDFVQKEERADQISKHANEFYWEVDAEGIFTFVSPVIEQILNFSSNDIVGKKNYINLFQLDKIKDKKRLSRSSIFNDFEFDLKLDNGTIWLSMSGFPFYDKTGNFLGKRGVCYNITARKQDEIELKKNVQKIENYQKTLKNLNKEVILVEEKERRRIAENLHDSLGQTLSLAFMKLSVIIDKNEDSNLSDLIIETSDLLKNAITESRTLTYDLSPPILYELGLIAAFEWKLEQIEKKHKIRTVIFGKNQILHIKKEYNIFLFRTVNELITNIIKHAKADLIELKINEADGLYTIIVSDNGVGFKKKQNRNASTKGGFGLVSIAERMESLNGHFEIKSELGKGTQAKLIFPRDTI